MPTAALQGTIDSASLDFLDALSVTWGLVPGNSGWSLRNGEGAGETQICSVGDNGVAVLNHPIDAFYDATTTEGWPFIVVEVWDKSTVGVKGFAGCGCAWIPPSSGKHAVDVHIWKPSSSGADAFAEMLLPTVPDLKRLREIVVSPYLRSAIQTESVGTVRVQINVTLFGFDSAGVRTD
jgi:hypothetical protein